MTGVFIGRGRSIRDVLYTEVGPSEDTGRRQLSKSQGERLQEVWGARNRENKFLLIKPLSLWYGVIAPLVD